MYHELQIWGDSLNLAIKSIGVVPVIHAADSDSQYLIASKILWLL